MWKKILFVMSLFLCATLHAEIIEIHQIDDIRPYVKDNALYLFDIDDTLIDNPCALGSGPWRNWVKTKLPAMEAQFNVFDALTLYIAKKIPYKAVEPTTPDLIADLQDSGHAVFAFTARGRSQWYTTHVEGLDEFTHKQLGHAGIDFSQTKVPVELIALDPVYLYDGVIYANHVWKGDMLKLLFTGLEYYPSGILFVDDRLDQVQSVESAANEMGIPFMGFWYRRAGLDREDFNSMIANIQLEYLLLKGEFINDDEAWKLAQENPDMDPQAALEDIFQQIDLNQIAPVLWKN